MTYATIYVNVHFGMPWGAITARPVQADNLLHSVGCCTKLLNLAKVSLPQQGSAKQAET